MDAIGVTDPEWVSQLKASPKDEVVFWTPTPWSLARLKEGDRWYFMLKAPIRKIGGFGRVIRYDVMKASEAWAKWGEANGVRSLAELRTRTHKYTDRRSSVVADPDPEIGCLVLREVEFWDEDAYLLPQDLGIGFPTQVVMFKYVEKEPGFVVVSDPEQLVRLNHHFETRMRATATRSGKLSLGYPGGRRDASVHWHEGLDFWCGFEQEHNRSWNAFGLGNPFTTLPQIVAEINFPHDGINRRIGGALVTAADEMPLVAHRGRVGGGRPGIGQLAFMDYALQRLPVISARDGDQVSTLLAIGGLDSPELLLNVRAFLDVVVAFKDGPAEPTDETRKFSPEYEDQKKYTRDAKDVVLACRHASVINQLERELRQRGLKVGNDQHRDLVVYDRSDRVRAVCEAKTSTGSYDVYTAIGQLFMHTLGTSGHRIAVLPSPISPNLADALEQLSISCLAYDTQPQGIVFIGLEGVFSIDLDQA